MGVAADQDRPRPQPRAHRGAPKADELVSVAVGEPSRNVEGFSRTHQQAVSAQSVALAAGTDHVKITPFVEVAPIAMLCADLDSARAWVHEALGDLAIDTTRNAGLRDTARVFLETGGSYTATAEQLSCTATPRIPGAPGGRGARTSPARTPARCGARARRVPLAEGSRAPTRDVTSVALRQSGAAAASMRSDGAPSRPRGIRTSRAHPRREGRRRADERPRNAR